MSLAQTISYCKRIAIQHIEKCTTGRSKKHANDNFFNTEFMMLVPREVPSTDMHKLQVDCDAEH